MSEKNYNYKIVVDSCCELPEQYLEDPRFQRVPLTLTIEDENIIDDDSFDQLYFINKVKNSEDYPRSACPSPQSYMDAFTTNAEHVYCVTLSSKLSGSYNSAVIGKSMYEEEHENDNTQIHIFDSESASVGETQIAMMILKYEEEGLSFEEIVKKVEAFRDELHTYFVLDSLDTFIKNGRIKGIKALAVKNLNIKPVMAGLKGEVVQKGQGIGLKKALGKMVEIFRKEVSNKPSKSLYISHCNCPERAQFVKNMFLELDSFANVVILDMRGVSTMYADDGGIIVTC